MGWNTRPVSSLCFPTALLSCSFPSSHFSQGDCVEEAAASVAQQVSVWTRFTSWSCFADKTALAGGSLPCEDKGCHSGDTCAYGTQGILVHSPAFCFNITLSFSTCSSPGFPFFLCFLIFQLLLCCSDRKGTLGGSRRIRQRMK